MIIWRGKSLLDKRTPIVVVATGIRNKSSNSKTGAMVQTWILVDDEHPMEALKTGADAAICGDCPHRGVGGKQRACYVGMYGPGAVWKALRAGHVYEDASRSKTKMAEAVRGRVVRLGAYGDPAAVPVRVWQNLLRYATGYTGYTHQWRSADPALRQLCMASVDSPIESAAAQASGWRTFRVREAGARLFPNEIICPAAEEAGKRTTCQECQLCDGKRDSADRRRNIAIVAHGSGRKQFKSNRLPVLQTA